LSIGDVIDGFNFSRVSVNDIILNEVLFSFPMLFIKISNIQPRWYT